MRILVIRRDNIGDLVCTTPLISALKRRHPEGWLGAYVNSYNAPVLSNNPDVDEILDYTKLKHLKRGDHALSALGRRLSTLWRLRRVRLDLVVLATTDFSPKLVGIARLLAPRQVAGFSDGSRAAAALDVAVPIGPLHAKHEVERVYALAPLLSLEPAPPPLKVIASPDEVRKAAGAIAGGRRRIAVHISARRPRQRWPTESFVQLIRELCADGDTSVLLLWSPGMVEDARHPGDDEKARRILDATGPIPVRGYATRRLEELIGALAASDAVVCSDGGAMHIAAALKKPIVCFFGDSPVYRWRPWGVAHRVLQAPSRNVADVPVDDALAAVRALMQ